MSLRPIPFSARIALAGLALAFACTLLAPWIAPHGEEEIVGGVWDLPSWSAGGSAFLLGTDNLGRDLLSRLIFGARTTILVAGGATLLSFSLGIVLSFTASVMRGWTDQLLSRFNDLMMAIPTLIFALVVLAVLPQTLWILVLVMAILDSTRVFRLGRAVATDIAVMDFVEAARLRGEGTLWIIFREILPNALSPLLAEFGLRFAFAVLFLSTLSFLGLGIQPPAADWGGMVKDNKDGLIFGVSAALYPGLAIASLAVCVNLVVDWLLNRTASLKGGAGMNAGAELLRVRGLCIGARVAPPGEAARDVSIVENVSFDLAKGRVLGLIGESGAGKSTIGLSVLGYGRGTVRITGGSMRLGGTELVGLNARGLRRVRGAKVAYVAQSAAAAFNPAFRLGHQVIEASLKHGLLSREAARGRAVELFRTLGLPQPESFGARYPHQVSGGQLQRAMTAMALLPAPDLIVFDEPTTALDVTTQIDVLVAIKRAIEDTHTAAIYVTHDLAVVAQVADDIMVLRHGRTVEYGTARQILEAPREGYTQRLVAMRHLGKAAADRPDRLLMAEHVEAGYPSGLTVLHDVSLHLARGHPQRPFARSS